MPRHWAPRARRPAPRTCGYRHEIRIGDADHPRPPATQCHCTAPRRSGVRVPLALLREPLRPRVLAIGPLIGAPGHLDAVCERAMAARKASGAESTGASAAIDWATRPAAE